MFKRYSRWYLRASTSSAIYIFTSSRRPTTTSKSWYQSSRSYSQPGIQFYHAGLLQYSFCRSDAASAMKQWLAFRTQTEGFRPQAECWRWIDYPELFWPCCEPFAPRLARVNKIPGNSVYLHQRAYAQSTPRAEGNCYGQAKSFEREHPQWVFE